MRENQVDFVPVFITGSSRTGTSMMARILGNHEEVFSFPHELHFFEQMWSPSMKKRPIAEEEAVRMASRLLGVLKEGYLTLGDPGAYAGEAGQMLEGLGKRLTTEEVFINYLGYVAAKERRRYLCEHTPRNLFYVEEILELMPGAKIIAMVRDPRDVLLSQKKKWRVRYTGARKYIPLGEAFRSWVNYHPVTTSLLWRSSMRAVERIRDNPKVLVVRYEDVVEDPAREVERVCEFVGIDYHERLLDIPVVGSSLTMSAPGRRGIMKRPEGWMGGGLNRTEVFLCQLIAGPLMRRYGYHPVPVRAGLFMASLYMTLLPLKLSAAFVANLRRTESILSAVGRRLR